MAGDVSSTGRAAGPRDPARPVPDAPLALYRRYQEQGAAFRPGYLKLLSYGGAARPEAILSEFGIDMTDRSFWQGGFDLVRERIDELEAIRI